MRNKRSNKIKLFLLLLLVITVGYALLSQTLDINGTTNIKSSNWSIIWDNVVVKDGSVSGDSVTTGAAITNTEKTLVEYSISLSEPGEFYEFTVDAKNEGTIDGMVNTVSNKVYESNGTTEKTLPEYLTYSVTYSDGKAIEPKQLLSAGSTEKYKVRVEFKDVSADKLPSQNETLKFKFEVEYVQADESGVPVPHPYYIYRWSTNIWAPGQNIITFVQGNDYVSQESQVMNMDSRGSKYYLKYLIDNNTVIDNYVCFVISNEMVVTNPGITAGTFCLEGGTRGAAYTKNKEMLHEIFENADCDDDSGGFSCLVDEMYINVAQSGTVLVDNEDGYCSVDDVGYSHCNTESSLH